MDLNAFAQEGILNEANGSPLEAQISQCFFVKTLTDRSDSVTSQIFLWQISPLSKDTDMSRITNTALAKGREAICRGLLPLASLVRPL